MKTITLVILSLIVTTGVFGQTNSKPTIYKQNSWLDLKINGRDLIKAADHPIKEKVKITRTDNYIEVIFGEKKLHYQIISKYQFSDFKTDYKVTLDKKTYTLSIAVMPGQSIIIEIAGEWAVVDITEFS